MLKNTNKTRKTVTNFNLTTHSLDEKNYSISTKFKICISQLNAKTLLNNEAETKSDTVWQDIIKSDVINEFQNRNFSVLWLKWTQTKEIKLESINY